MTDNPVQSYVVDALEEIKGVDITILDVTHLTSITDVMIVCSGTSQRHVKSLANNVVETAKEHNVTVLGVEGMQSGEWVLVDLGSVVAHIMQPSAREFYNLEKLWKITETVREKAE